MVTITLPTELERAVADEAARSGTSSEQVTLDALRQRFLGRNAGGLSQSANFTLPEQLLGFLALREGWNGYDAPPPNRESVLSAASALIAMQAIYSAPDRLAPSAVGGVGITYRRGAKKAYLECYNSGQIVLLLSDSVVEQMETTTVEPTAEGLSQLPGKIKEYLDGGSA